MPTHTIRQEVSGMYDEAVQNGEGARGEPTIGPDEILAKVTTFAKENPHAALAVALGAGFLLGGGLTPKLAGAVGLMLARHYLRESIDEIVEAVSSGVESHRGG